MAGFYAVWGVVPAVPSHARQCTAGSEVPDSNPDSIKSYDSSAGSLAAATYSGSIAEVTAEAALYAQPNDHHSLYLRMKQLLLERDTWSRLSSAGQRIARARFDVNLVASRMARVYRDVLSGGDA